MDEFNNHDPLNKEYPDNDNMNQQNSDTVLHTDAVHEGVRSFVGDSAWMSTRKYNLMIGAHLLYGLILTAVICSFMGRIFATTYISHPYIFSILFLLVSIGGSKLAHTESYGMSLLGYTIVVLGFGSLTASFVPFFALPLVIYAAIFTSILVVVMTVCAFVFPNAFQGLGRTLFFSLLGLIVTELIAMLIGFSSDIFSLVGLFIFALYVGYDWSKGQQYPKLASYAVITAMELYMDVINIFIRILSLMGRRK